MLALPRDFREFLRLLNAHDVEYLVIGGYAVGFHGYPRATVDLDVWVRREPKNAERVVKAPQDFGFDVPELKPELFVEPNKIVRMGVPPMRLEILTSIDGISFESCYPRGVEAEAGGVSTRFIALSDLRINKAASGRAKDLADLEELPP